MDDKGSCPPDFLPLCRTDEKLFPSRVVQWLSQSLLSFMTTHTQMGRTSWPLGGRRYHNSHWDFVG